MNPLLIILVVLIIAGFGTVLYFLRKPKSPQGEGLTLLQNQMAELSRTIDSKLGDSAKMLQDQSGHYQKIVKEITAELTRVTEGQKTASEETKEFAQQVRGLQDILKNPKHRGSFGEYQLETILGSVLPPGTYQMQYQMKNGTVDAAIFYQEKVIPVDSKFSLENYNRIIESSGDDERKKHESSFHSDLKKRIDETSKYIDPQGDTVDMAIMFIPSDAIFYDLLSRRVGSLKETSTDLLEYAIKRKVTIASPTTFLALLQIIVQGLRQIEFNKSAETIRKNVENLRKHMESYESYFKKLGNHIGTTVSTYNKAGKELGKIDKDVLKITGAGTDSDIPSLEKPEEQG